MQRAEHLARIGPETSAILQKLEDLLELYRLSLKSSTAVPLPTDVSWSGILAKWAQFAPIQRGRIYNAAIASGADFFSPAITVVNTPSNVRTVIALAQTAILHARIQASGLAVQDTTLNAGVALAAGSLYVFDTPIGTNAPISSGVSTGGVPDTFNLQVAVGGVTIQYCVVLEIPSGIV